VRALPFEQGAGIERLHDIGRICGVHIHSGASIRTRRRLYPGKPSPAVSTDLQMGSLASCLRHSRGSAAAILFDSRFLQDVWAMKVIEYVP